MSASERPSVADFYEREVLPALVARLDGAFPEFGWTRDARGWHATSEDFTHATLGVRAERVVCHGEAPRGLLIHGVGPTLWTTYVNRGTPARGLDFIDAVRQLASRASVDPRALDRAPTPLERRSAVLENLMRICQRELTGQQGTVARAHLDARGILVDFAMFPHLDHDAMPEHSMANAERWAAGLPVPGYAMDDETAIKVVGGTVEVVSEGHWEMFNPSPKASEAG